MLSLIFATLQKQMGYPLASPALTSSCRITQEIRREKQHTTTIECFHTFIHYNNKISSNLKLVCFFHVRITNNLKVDQDVYCVYCASISFLLFNCAVYYQAIKCLDLLIKWKQQQQNKSWVRKITLTWKRSIRHDYYLLALFFLFEKNQRGKKIKICLFS